MSSRIAARTASGVIVDGVDAEDFVVAAAAADLTDDLVLGAVADVPTMFRGGCNTLGAPFTPEP
tara:strand:+ start:7124 stop:7315 length:192 start_codon:yes stop_codon:yes gene_type:complete